MLTYSETRPLVWTLPHDNTETVFISNSSTPNQVIIDRLMTIALNYRTLSRKGNGVNYRGNVAFPKSANDEEKSLDDRQEKEEENEKYDSITSINAAKSSHQEVGKMRRKLFFCKKTLMKSR